MNKMKLVLCSFEKKLQIWFFRIKFQVRLLWKKTQNSVAEVMS